ncbi:MAG: MFS transporter [Arachidicoccus sp.]|nr:MFS transporter [Arachidicoccus sp.]
MQNSARLKASSHKIPAALWALAISVFAIGTTEVVMVGLLPTIAKDLSISISATGLIVTLYALGVAVGGPLITAFTSHVPRKRLLLGIMLLFILGNTIAALAKNFSILAAGRILSGFAHGVFVGIGATIAGSLVSEDKRATAIAIMFAGLTVAMVTGVPLGTLVGQHYGWRFTFAGVAILGAVGFAAILILLPNHIAKGNPLRIKDQLKVLQNKSLLLGFSLTVFSFAGVFGTFTYLSPLLQKITKFSSDTITILLLIYGAFVALGNLIGGKISNKNPVKVLMILFLLLAFVLFLLYLFIPYKIQTIIILAFMGFFAFSIVPGMQLYVVQLAEKHLPGTEDVSSALNIAAFNIGIAMGSYVGGLIVESAFGIRAVAIEGSLFVIIAFLFSIISSKREKIYQ